MIPVTSSNLASVGYDPTIREMRVQFKSGALHYHVEVPPEEHSALMAAESHGKRYNSHIKNVYTSRKMGGMPPQEDDPGVVEAEQYPRASREPAQPRSLDEAITRFTNG